jgi:hypothetical protein
MEFKVNKEMVKSIGSVAGKLGKTIVIEGFKAVLLNAAATTIKTSFDEGFAGVKNLTFDELLDGKDKKKTVKGSIFRSKKNKDEEDGDVEILNADSSKVTK